MRDAAGASPRNDVLSATTGAFNLGMRRGHVNLYSLADLESGGVALLV